MEGLALFNAITKIDEDLIDRYVSEKGSEHRFAERKRTWVVRGIAAAASFALMIGVFLAVKKGTERLPFPGENSELGLFSLKISAKDVYIDGGTNPENADRDLATYIFGKPAGDALKYVGYWIAAAENQAMDLHEDGTFTLYLLRDRDHYKYRYSGYYSISDNVATMYLPEEETGAILGLDLLGSLLKIKTDSGETMFLEKAENSLTEAFTESQAPAYAPGFTGRLWILDNDVQIIFRDDRTVVFIAYEREEGTYEWDDVTNTVILPDWHKQNGVYWTGRIENRDLILSCGDTVHILYNPEVMEERRRMSFPVSHFLYEFCDKASFEMTFYYDGTYEIGRMDSGKPWRDILYTGRYEIQSVGYDDPGSLITIFPSGEDSSFLPRDSVLRYFTDLCDPQGEVFVYEEIDIEDQRIILRKENGDIRINLYLYYMDSEKE